LKAFKCNRCKTFSSGVPAIKYEYYIRIVGADPDGALCDLCEVEFIRWIKKDAKP